MHRNAMLVSFFTLVGGSACVEPIIFKGPDDGPRDQFPQEDAWQLEIDAPLAEDVAQITIGGRRTEENFANRGDVEVRFDGEEGRIRVEVQRYGFAADEQLAAETFERLWVWAYAGESLRPPAPDMIENDCTQLWHDACVLRVYYDGQYQPERSGAHFRVTLPPSYLGELTVVTEDNVEDGEYPLRGDVRISDLRGSADIEVERGNVEVRLADDSLVAPACGVEANETCAQWQEDELDAPWALSCGCYDFGHLRVEGVSSDLTVDVPPSLWTNLRLQNHYLDQVGLECEVDLGCEGFDRCEVTFVDEDVHGPHVAEANDPGESAVEGAGFAVHLDSKSCASVEFVDGPDDYAAAMYEQRGDLRVCSGCLD